MALDKQVTPAMRVGLAVGLLAMGAVSVFGGRGGGGSKRPGRNGTTVFTGFGVPSSEERRARLIASGADVFTPRSLWQSATTNRVAWGKPARALARDATVWPWLWTVPGRETAAVEHARMLRDSGCAGVVIDPEAPYYPKSRAGTAAMGDALKVLIDGLHSAGVLVGTFTYGSPPSWHPMFPWEALKLCDAILPMAYTDSLVSRVIKSQTAYFGRGVVPVVGTMPGKHSRAATRKAMSVACSEGAGVGVWRWEWALENERLMNVVKEGFGQCKTDSTSGHHALS